MGQIWDRHQGLSRGAQAEPPTAHAGDIQNYDGEDDAPAKIKALMHQYCGEENTII
eukprot:SAG11_NODE_32446_length_283_cov_1.130435_1_plen_55_part_10